MCSEVKLNDLEGIWNESIRGGQVDSKTGRDSPLAWEAILDCRLLSSRKFDKRFRRTVVRYFGDQVGFWTRSIAMSFSKSNDK
jgi:hypothetical protein